MTSKTILLAICCSALSSIAPPAHAYELSQTVREAMVDVAPSVVRIRIIGSPDAGELSVSSQVTTGVAISEDGHVLTSVFGLTSTPAAVFVEDSNGQRVAAKVVAKDHVRKLALLKCEEGTFKPAGKSADQLPQVGEWAIALGRLYPSKQPSTSVGIISAVGRIHGLAIQTDAKISPVNYGGPLVNLQGKVTGILVPLSPRDSGDAISAGVEWYDSGIGFAIPMTDALKVAETLSNGEDRVKGVIGIRPSTRNPLETEVLVDFVFPKSPAEAAGLQKGDRIITANGQPIARFGVFDSLAKSSYAGEKMALTVERDTQQIEAELTLAAEIERPVRGFLGIIINEAADSDGKDGEAKGASVWVLPDSPAANAGLAESVIITGWNDEEIDNSAALLKQFRMALAGSEVKLRFKPAEAAEPQTATVTLQRRPNQILTASGAIIDSLASKNDKTEWGRKEMDLGESGKVWMFAPKGSTEAKYGVVCLLSESVTPPELVIKLWEPTCRRHNLVIAVPVNQQQTALTREDAALIPRALSEIAKEYKVDLRRILLVAEKPQALLCTELLLNQRLRQFKAAVFLNCWAQVSGLPKQLLAAKSPAVLLINGAIQSRQATALRTQSVEALQEAGVWAISESAGENDQTTIEDRIALWALNLKAR